MHYSQTRDELLDNLSEQLIFLRKSCTEFDNGFEAEAKRMAVSLRVLFHNSRTSTALLSALDLINKLEFFTCLVPINEKTINYVGVSMGLSEDGKFKYFPKDTAPTEKLDFNNWWNQVALLNKVNDVCFTRKDIILFVANQDGGAHIDPKINKGYADLARFNGFGWEVTDGNGESGSLANGPQFAFIRQVAEEVLFSLYHQLHLLK